MMYFHTLERVLDPVHPLLVLPRESPLHSRYPRSLPAVLQEPEELLSFEIFTGRKNENFNHNNYFSRLAKAPCETVHKYSKNLL